MTVRPFLLFGRPNSGSFAVQVALEEAAAPYEVQWVGEQPADLALLREVNPAGKVPALRLPDGTVLFESAAILVHLAATLPGAALGPPPETTRHGLFLQWMVFMSANIYEALLRVYYAQRYTVRGGGDAEGVREQAAQDVLASLRLASSRLGPYILGGEYSIADVYLYMLASWWPGDKLKLHADLPLLAAHSLLIQQRPAVRKVDADHSLRVSA